MKIFDIFSKRQKRLRGELPDVYDYENIPSGLKVQIVHIWRDAFGSYTAYGRQAPEVLRAIYNSLCREYGVFKLNEYEEDAFTDLAKFLISTTEVEKAIDVIELSFRCIDRICRQFQYIQNSEPQISADDAIDELNKRFQEHGVGYQYESEYIIRVDSQFIHSEVIKPALGFLLKPGFEGPNEEFLKAHEHYRNTRYKECLNECLKALESTLKTICKTKGWSYKETDTANTLINICFQNNLIPDFLQSEFSALRSLLESGTPTVRNKMSGHGQGTNLITVPAYLAAYLLHITGSSILLLVEAAA